MRWLLLDEIVSIQKNEKAVTRSRMPETAVSPEPILMEIMAQTGGLLLGAQKDFRKDIIFAKIETADFFDPQPGEPLEIEATSENLRPEGSWMEAVIRTSGGRRVARSRFLLMSVGRLDPEVSEPIVFHEAFMNHFRVREKVNRLCDFSPK